MLHVGCVAEGSWRGGNLVFKHIMVDTIQIHQTFMLPAAKGVKAIPVDVDGYAVVNNDSLQDVLCGIRDSLNQQQQTVEQLETKLNEISTYGIGFDDTISDITIPLIIALFAFAFPFLFTVITHINNKYGSEHISTMFSSDSHYQRFMNMTKVCATYLIVAAFSALVFRGICREVAMIIVNWTSLLMAAAYAYCTYQFVKTCVWYNDTKELLKLITKKYKEDLTGAKKGEEKLERLASRAKYKFWKSENWKKYYQQALIFRKPFLKFNADIHHVERLIDLSRYAISHREDLLFSQILFTMDELTEIEKKMSGDKMATSFKGIMTASMLRHTKKFYEAVHEHYALYGNNKEIEERLLNGQLRALNRSLFPNDSDVVSVMKSVVNAVERGNTTLFDKYIQESLYGYNFIMRLPLVAYIRGFDEEGQKAVDQQEEKEWNELREIHFLTAAYLFSKRHYGIIAPLLTEKTRDRGRLYPTAGPEILKCYLRCKEKQNKEGEYNYWMTDKLFDQSLDRDMLEKYVAALLTITNTKAEMSKTILSEGEIGKLKQEKDLLAMFARQNMNDSDLTRQYPKILQVDFGQLFDDSVRTIERNANLGDVDDSCNFFVILGEAFNQLFFGEQPKERKPTIYDIELDKKAVQNADAMAESVLYRNKPLVEFLGSKAEGKTQEMKVGVMTCCYDKRLFIEEKIDWFMYFKHIFSERVTFMIFMAMKEMEHEEVDMDAAEFETYFMNYTHGHPEEYAVIDTDSMFKYMLDMRLNDGHLFGADCYDTGMTTGRYISDLPEMAEFEKRMIIIRKDDLPVLVAEDGHKAPETSVKEDTDKEKGRAVAWLNVNPHLKLLYNKESQYVMVKQVSIKG